MRGNRWLKVYANTVLIAIHTERAIAEAHCQRLPDSQRMEIRALRLGGYYSNQRIKYAFVTEDANVTHAIEKSVSDGLTLHATKVFRGYQDAVAWVGS